MTLAEQADLVRIKGLAILRLASERQINVYRQVMRRELHLFEPHIVAAVAEKGIAR